MFSPVTLSVLEIKGFWPVVMRYCTWQYTTIWYIVWQIRSCRFIWISKNPTDKLITFSSLFYIVTSCTGKFETIGDCFIFDIIKWCQPILWFYLNRLAPSLHVYFYLNLILFQSKKYLVLRQSWVFFAIVSFCIEHCEQYYI